jgi:positive regulator of sigma E activity
MDFVPSEFRDYHVLVYIAPWNFFQAARLFAMLEFQDVIVAVTLFLKTQ